VTWLRPRQFPALVTIIAALSKQRKPGRTSPENDRPTVLRLQWDTILAGFRISLETWPGFAISGRADAGERVTAE
jgi:hypothetical protein